MVPRPLVFVNRYLTDEARRMAVFQAFSELGSDGIKHGPGECSSGGRYGAATPLVPDQGPVRLASAQRKEL